MACYMEDKNTVLGLSVCAFVPIIPILSAVIQPTFFHLQSRGKTLASFRAEKLYVFGANFESNKLLLVIY